MKISSRHPLVVVLLSVFPVFAADPAVDPFAGTEPIVVWVQTDPWLDVLYSDTPNLAIYETGEVVYLDRSRSGNGYRRVVLTPERFKKIRRDILALGKFPTWRCNYNVKPNVTDQPTTILFIRFGEIYARTKVYGLTTPGTRLRADNVAKPDRGADALPEGLTALHRYLASLRFQGSTAWVPKYWEVMLWPYEYAPQESIHWPTDWPNFASAMSRQHGELHSVFLPGAKLHALQEFLKTRKPKGAVELDGRKWAIAYRPVFPGEPKWRRAKPGC